MNNVSTHIAELAYVSDFGPDVPQTLRLKLDDKTVASIRAARELMQNNSRIQSINIQCRAPDIEEWRFDVWYIRVYPLTGSYLYIQGKYDCAEQVEYILKI